MTKHPPDCASHSTPLLYALRVGAWVTLLFLVLWLTGCSFATPGALLRPDPAPANLTERCAEGPAPPQGDTTLEALAGVVKERERAAAECRLRHGKLADWALKVAPAARGSD